MSNNNVNKRHVAKIANTDQRCVVAFMQIPGREDHALVIPTDTLPPRYEQALMQILESAEGQGEETLALVLGRRLMPDTGKSVLETLHTGRYLVPTPVSQVVMFPRPNMPFPLVDILRGMNRLPAYGSSVSNANEDAARNKYNQHAVNLAHLSQEQQHGIARNLIVEAEMLEHEANQKREKAYHYNPTLRPKTVELPEAIPLDAAPLAVEPLDGSPLDGTSHDGTPHEEVPFSMESYFNPPKSTDGMKW